MEGMARKTEDLAVTAEKISHVVGLRIGQIIAEKKLRRSEVADSAHIDRGSLTRIISGERTATLDQVLAIAGVLKVAPGALMTPMAPAGPPVEEDELPEGLAHYLAPREKRIAPVVVEHLKRSQFTSEGALDDEFWDEQRAIWEKRLGLGAPHRDPGAGGVLPEKKS